MEKRLSLFTISIILAAAVSINAQENNENNNGNNEANISNINVEIADEPAVILDGSRLTISDAIKKAIEANPDMYMSRYDAAMADTDYMKFNAQYSPFLKIEGKTSSESNPILFYNRYGKKIDNTGASVSVAKNFSTGTTVAVGVSDTYSKMDSGTGYKFEMNIPVAFASIEQELLKNAFGYNNRRQERILNNVTLAKKDARIYSMSMIALVVIADYWAVVAAQNQLDNSRLMLAETKRVRKIVSGKVKIGLSEQFEINYWDSLVAFSKTKLSQSELNYRNSLRKFYSDLNSDKEITMQAKVVLSDKLPAINTDVAIKIALAKRADYLNAIRSLENSKLTLQIHENNALPSVKGSVSGSQKRYDIDSTENPANTNPYSEDCKLRRNYEAKLTLTYPLDDTNQEVEERNARWAIEQAKKNLEKTTRSVKDDVTTKIENINTRYEIYDNAKEARKQAALFYNSMLTNLSRGRFAASSVRDALDRLVTALDMELQLLIAYNASLIEFEIAKNELFEAYNIDINKYIHEE